jgi:hypothetical protein
MAQPISSTIPNLINGISQQSPTLRLASQAERVTNFLPSVVDGLVRRAPVRHIAKLSNDDLGASHIHTISRDASERYKAVISEGGIRVFDSVTGGEKTVNAPDGWDYLDSDSATDYRAFTVADYTLVLNRSKKVANLPALTPARPNQAIVFVKAGNYGKTYNIYINGKNRARFYTPDGSHPSHVLWVSTSIIAERLYWSLRDGAFEVDTYDYTHYPAFTQETGDFATFTYALEGNVIIITSSSPTPFTVRVDDATGGTAISAVVSSVQRFSDLPKEAPHGFITEVVGDNLTKFDNFYVQFRSEGQAGVWTEVAKGSEVFSLDPDTMPHVLVREADATFTFKRAEWEPRKVGDRERIPDPSFVGRTISDVFFHRNRFGLLSDESTTLSKDGKFFDFFPDTATTTLDTDPIDVAVTSSAVAVLDSAVPFNKSLVLFSAQAQFVLEGGELLTPGSVSITQTTAYETITDVRPNALGAFIYFPSPRGNYTGLREYMVEDGGVLNEAPDVTAHIPRLIPAGVTRLVGSSSEDMLVMFSPQTQGKLWVYRYFFGSEGKLQSAWVEWHLPAGGLIRDVSFLDAALQLLTYYPGGGTYLEEINIRPTVLGEFGTGHTIHLDRCARMPGGSYSIATDKTTFTAPFLATAGIRVVSPSGDPLISEVGGGGTQVLVRGNHSGQQPLVGYPYTSLFEFSTLYLREGDRGGGTSAVQSGRLQLRRMHLDYSRSGEFSVIVKGVGRDAVTYQNEQRIVGIMGDTAGSRPIAAGRFSFPIMGRNTDTSITITTDSIYTVAFNAAEWEGAYTTRNSRA